MGGLIKRVCVVIWYISCCFLISIKGKSLKVISNLANLVNSHFSET